MNDRVHEENERALELVSFYLNYIPDHIDRETVDSIVGESTDMRDYAFSAIMAAACGLDAYENAEDKQIFRKYFIPMVKGLRADEYRSDWYYKNIKIPSESYGRWKLETKKYKPFEAFVYDDIEMRADGRILPRIGYFDEELEYPSVSENGREWMTVTPNEINTMKKAISGAHGNVLTFGLGLGYYACMVSEKAEVESITVVDRDKEVIELFERFILPQFAHPEKVRIVCSDAFEFADSEFKNGYYDYIFTDLWHDPSDGIDLYLKMKEREKLCPGAEFEYWIEKTLKVYIGKGEEQ